MTRGWLALAILVGATVTLIILTVTSEPSDLQKEVRLDLAHHPVTVRVARRPLVATADVDGRLVAAPPPQLDLASDAEGKIVTDVAVDGASVIQEGDTIASIEGSPVVVLQGRLPAYRDLSVGNGGPDAAQLMSALVRLGLPCRCGSRLTAIERDAVRSRLLSASTAAMGRRDVLPASSVVWVARLPVHVARVGATVGQPAKNPFALGRVVARRAIATTTDGTRISIGMRTTVRTPGGRAMRGHVMRVDVRSGRFWTTIPPMTMAAKAATPVVVTVETLKRHGSVPAVPAAALKREGGTKGSVAVVGTDGTVAIRRVSIGPDLNGWVGIRRGVTVGQRVVVASWDADAPDP